MEKRPSRAAQKGSRDNVPCRVKGRRPLWGLGQRPNCCTVRPVKRFQRSGCIFARPQTRPPISITHNLHIVVPMGATG